MRRRKAQRMLVIAAVCLKGGSGKTTVSQALGSVFYARGYRTMILDLDPGQLTCLKWSARAAEEGQDTAPVTSVDGAALRRDLLRLAEDGYEVVIIDCPPRQSRETREAIGAAHLILVPVSPGQGDLWAVEQTAELISELRGEDVVLRAVLNRAQPSTGLSREMAPAIARHLPLLGARLCNRVAFPEAMGAGMGVMTYEPNGRAALEAAALTDEALAVLAEAAA